MQEVILGIILVLVLAFCSWILVRTFRAGQTEEELENLREDRERRKRGDEIMSEPIADEDPWLARARERLRRMREQAKH